MYILMIICLSWSEEVKNKLWDTTGTVSYESYQPPPIARIKEKQQLPAVFVDVLSLAEA